MEYVVNIVAHVNHGKTTLMDSVMAHVGAVSRTVAGKIRMLDTREDEKERGITMKITPVTVGIKTSRITFLDTPGHLEFNSLTLSTFVIADMSVVVLDITQGVTERLRGLLRQMQKCRVRPLLFVNKVEALLKTKVTLQEAEQRIRAAVRGVNDTLPDSEKVGWRKGTVVLGSAKDGWAISSRSAPSAELEVDTAEMNPRTALLAAQIAYETRKEAEAREVLASSFGLFQTLAVSICHTGRSLVNPFVRPAPDTSGFPGPVANQICFRDTPPGGVIGVVCSNTLVGRELVSVLRMYKGRGVEEGEDVCILEDAGSVLNGRIEKVLEFTHRGLGNHGKTEPETPEARGFHSVLIGVVGLPIKKRGLVLRRNLGSAELERIRAYYRAVGWPEFVPIFSDVIHVPETRRDEALQLIRLLSRCEPGMVFSTTENKDVLVRSNGQLQIDKVLTDLEHLGCSVSDQSAQYMETPSLGSGIVEMQGSRFFIEFAGTGGSREKVPRGGQQCFKRECHVAYRGNIPAAMKHSVLSLLQNGPYLGVPVDMAVVTVEEIGVDTANTANTEEIAEQKREDKHGEASTLSRIYMSSNPKVLANHTLVRISTPLSYVTPVTAAISKYAGLVLDSGIAEDSFFFEAKVPVKEMRGMAALLRTVSKGECDVLPSGRPFFDQIASVEHEKETAKAIRKEKGLDWQAAN